jgi:RND family efflux transporter MFP subunit
MSAKAELPRKALSSRRARRRLLVALACALAIVPAACQKQQAAEKKLPIVVRAAEVAVADYVPKTSLTGVIAARTLNNLSFRVGGRVAERFVEVGQHVDKDTLLARIDPQEQESDLRSAQADLDAAQAQLTQAAAAFERQKTLLGQGFTTRRDYDQAEQALHVSQGSVQQAQSQLDNARESLTFTELRAGAAGIVTARLVEAGQVVQAAQTVFTLAEDGDRDAVFNVHETLVAGSSKAPPVTIALVADPSVEAMGEVREISPAVDPASGSIRVKVSIPNTPAAMQLGNAVIGTVSANPAKAVVLPWQALMSSDGRPSVWVIDPATKAVSATPVELLAYDTGVIVIDKGLQAGQQVVTAGGQLLSPGEVVEISTEAAQ